MSRHETHESEWLTESRRVRIFAGRAHPGLAQDVANHLGLPITPALVSTFSNGETRVEIQESVRGRHSYVINPICRTATMSVNDVLIEILVFASALRRSGCKTVTVVVPILAYARQDKKEKSRASITARLVADLLETSGIDQIITIDLHSNQIEGFFSERVMVDNIGASSLLVSHIKKLYFSTPQSSSRVVIVSPDAGGTKRAAAVAKELLVPMAIIGKERAEAGVVKSMQLVGDVKGKICILIDDMADTCGTLIEAAITLKKFNAIEVHAYVVHGVLSGKAIERLNQCDALESLVVTNSLPQEENMKRCPKLQVIDVSELLAHAIKLVHTNQSLTNSLSEVMKTKRSKL